MYCSNNRLQNSVACWNTLRNAQSASNPILVFYCFTIVRQSVLTHCFKRTSIKLTVTTNAVQMCKKCTKPNNNYYKQVAHSKISSLTLQNAVLKQECYHLPFKQSRCSWFATNFEKVTVDGSRSPMDCREMVANSLQAIFVCSSQM